MNTGALHGTRIVITRARSQAGDFSERLNALGATVILFPTVDVVAPHTPLSIDASDTFEWLVFTSANAVTFFAQGLDQIGRSISEFTGCRVCAVGPATAHAARAHGLRVEALPDEYVAQAIPPALGEISGTNILLPRANIASPELATQLKSCGATVTEVVAYCTMKASRTSEETTQLVRQSPDIITFTSSSTARNFHEILGQESLDTLRKTATFASIGPKTTATAEGLRIEIDIQPAQHDIPALVDAIVEWTRTHGKNDNE